MSTPRTRVLFVAGYERSGSTLIQNVIAQALSMCAVGELREVWKAGLLENRPCGCSRPFNECPIWQSVMEKAFGTLTEAQARHLCEMSHRVRTRLFPLTLLPGSDHFFKHLLGDYPAALKALYDSRARRDDGATLVDTSKSPVYAYVLKRLAGLDVRILHVVRDVRGVTHSILKRRDQGHAGYANYSPLRVAIEWMITNKAVEWTTTKTGCPYRRIRYESFVSDPESALRGVFDWMGETEEPLDYVYHQQVKLSNTHTVVGSPSRFNTGTIQLRLDDKWRDALSRSTRKTLERWTAPTLRSYGYA
mgnify:CR=1 FL=1